MTASRATRFLELCNQAAERLGGDAKPSDANVQHLAALLLSQEDYVARLIDGVDDINPDVLLRLDEAIRVAAPPKIPKVDIHFVEGVTGIFTCKHCGERNEIEDYVAPPPQSNPAPTTPTSSESSPTLINGSGGIVAKSEAKAASVPLPPPPPPPPPPRNPSMAAWERAHGRTYNRSSRDGGPIHGAPAFYPTSKYNQGYNNDAPVCWTGYMGGTRPFGTAVPDQNPNFNSDGSPRSPHKAPY